MSNIYNNNLYGGNPFIKDNDNNQGYDPYNSSQNNNSGESKKSDNSNDYYLPYQSGGAIEKPPASTEVFYQPSLIAWSGRIGRLRFLVYNLVLGVIFLKMLIIAASGLSLTASMIFGAVYLLFLIIDISVTKRRLNDLNQSGWLTLLFFIPVINIAATLYLLFAPGTPAPNRYGAMPAPANNTLWGAFALVGFIAIIAMILQYAATQAQYGYSAINSMHQSSDTSQNYSLDEFGDFVTQSESNVVLYATQWCKYCQKTRQFLADNKIDYVEYDIETSEQGAREFKDLHGAGVPLLRINSEIVTGYNPSAIMAALDENSKTTKP
jgi:mycoredoxin